MTHLDDKTALITGGGRGIGRAIALQLAQHGAHVAMAARSETELVETTSAIVAAGGRAHAIVADLAAPGVGTALAQRARDQIGHVDILINNAAVVAPLGASTDVDVEEFARAIEAHTVNLAAELAGTGVTVNAYRPGSVDTAMQAWIRDQDPDAIGRALHNRFVERHAAGDLITPEASAAALIRRLDGDATGEIWDVADDTSSRSRRTEETITRVPAGGMSGEAACVRSGR